MEFEDWDSFMEPQHFFYGEPSSASETPEPVPSSEVISSPASSTSSIIVDVATAILFSVAKVAIPATALVWYQNLSESTTPCHYKGSCHCESVQFEFESPRRLAIQTSRQQSRYNDVLHRFIRVQTSQFEIVKGEDYLKTFEMEDTADLASTSETISTISLGTAVSNREDQGARAFCRRCGVHILHAPSQHSKYIKVNVTCVTNPAKSNTKVLQDSAIEVATKTYASAKKVLSKTAKTVTRKTKDMIQNSDDYKSHPLVQSLLGLGDTILQVLRPYAPSSLGSKTSGTDLTISTTSKPSSTSIRRANSSASDDLSSVSNFSASHASRLELFHSAKTPKQANASAMYGTQSLHSRPPALPQQ